MNVVIVSSNMGNVVIFFGYNDDDEDGLALHASHISLTNGNFNSDHLKKTSNILMLSPEINLLKYMK